MKMRLVVLAIGLVGAFGLTGCKSISQSDYDAAIDENTQLRERIASLQDNVRQANERHAAITQENTQLREENARLRQGGPAGTGARGASGFEGIAGVDVGYRPGGEIVVGVAGDVLFASGQATLRQQARQRLDQVAQVLRSQYPNNVIRVEGHTDSDPIRRSGWKTNERLGAERAMAVQEYLVSKGVQGNRIYSATFGASRPRGNKEQSRRVEIVILAPGS
jgi:chemotaxis protein MotB